MAQEKWLVDGPKTIDVGDIRSLKVGLVGGQIDVIGHDEPGARIEVHSVAGRDLRVAVDGTALVIDHPQLDWENWIEAVRSFTGRAKAEVSVMVPRHVAVRLGVVSAGALVSGLTAPASLSTVSGDVVVDGLAGDLSLNAVSGELSVRDHHGAVRIKTVSGDSTVSGEVGSFASDGVSGAVYLDLAGDPDSIRVNTITGDVTVRLAGDTPTRYTITTVSGRLQLDSTEVRGVRGRYTGRYGALDRRWLDFSANTVSGDISVLHALVAAETP